MRWGASPDDWAHLDLVLGLTADLLPVVSNPNAVISPLSKIKALGKTPSRYNRQRQAAGIRDWTSKQATGAEIDRWSAESDYGICIQTRHVRAMDIDIEDEGLASCVFSFIVEHLGVFPATRSRNGSGKCLIPFWLEGAWPKRSFKCEGGLVEFLGNGQQFICHGTHPGGERYRWSHDAPPEPVVLSAEAFEALWTAMVAEFAVEPVREARSGKLGGVNLEGLDDPVAEWLEGHWETYGSRDGRLYVACPWREGHSSDSGETEASWLMAGSRGYEQGHYSCLHASCSGRTDEEFRTAVGCGVVDSFEVVELQQTNGKDHSVDAVELYAALGGSEAAAMVGAGGADGDAPWPALVRDKAGKIEATVGNLETALRRPDMCRFKIRFDTFQGALMLCGELEDVWRPCTDDDNFKIRVRLEKIGFKKIPRDMMRDALNARGSDARFDTALAWLSGLEVWDGVPRVETFWPSYFGVADSAYSRAAGLYAWTALAGRVMAPGCQADMIPVLIGAQGVGKSTGLAAMAPTPETFKTMHMGLKDADLSRKMRGLLVGEMAELGGFSRKESEWLKAWVTTKVENWTPKFLEYETAFARRFVCFGTTNDEQFLNDDTGERRWLPLTVASGARVLVEDVARDREQLWAEGLYLWKAGGIAWREAEQLAGETHRLHKREDSWADKVERWLDTAEGLGDDADRPRDRPLSGMEILEGAIGGPVRQYGRADEMRLSRIMRGLGYVNPLAWHEGKTRRRWVKDGVDPI